MSLNKRLCFDKNKIMHMHQTFFRKGGVLMKAFIKTGKQCVSTFFRKGGLLR
jgi:hypothetical protein